MGFKLELLIGECELCKKKAEIIVIKNNILNTKIKM